MSISEQTKRTIQLAKEIYLAYRNGDFSKLTHRHLAVIGPANFTVFKEKIIQKINAPTGTSRGKPALYFDNKSYAELIPQLLLFSRTLKKELESNPEYKITPENMPDIVFEDEGMFLDTSELKYAIWLFQKISDILRHGMYVLDFDSTPARININEKMRDGTEINISLDSMFLFVTSSKLNETYDILWTKQYLHTKAEIMKKALKKEEDYSYTWLVNQSNLDKQHKLSEYQSKAIRELIHFNQAPYLNKKKLADKLYFPEENSHLIEMKNKIEDYISTIDDGYEKKGRKYGEIEANFIEIKTRVFNLLENKKIGVSHDEFAKNIKQINEFITEHGLEREYVLPYVSLLSALINIDKSTIKDKGARKAIEDVIRNLVALLGLDKSNDNAMHIVNLYTYLNNLFSVKDHIEHSKYHKIPMVKYLKHFKFDGKSLVTYSKQLRSLKEDVDEQYENIGNIRSAEGVEKFVKIMEGHLNVFNSEIVRQLRNSIEHAHIEMLPDGKGEIEIVLSDYEIKNGIKENKFTCNCSEEKLFDMAGELEDFITDDNSKNSVDLIKRIDNCMEQMRYLLDQDELDKLSKITEKMKKVLINIR